MNKASYSKNITVYTDANSSLIIQKATERINEILFENKLVPVLFMLSGGSSFKLLNNINLDALSNNVTITVLDERYSFDPMINTFMQLKETDFYKNACARKCNFIDTSISKEDTLEESAERFEFEIRHWYKKNPLGLVYITQGMGPDGHTAGMMPYPESKQIFEELFMQTDKWVVGYNAENKNQYPERITVTIPFLKNNVETSIMYVSGKEKSDALDRALSGEGSIAETPALIIKEMKKVEVYNDIV